MLLFEAYECYLKGIKCKSHNIFFIQNLPRNQVDAQKFSNEFYVHFFNNTLQYNSLSMHRTTIS